MKLTLTQSDVTTIETDLLVIPVPGTDFHKLEVVNRLDAALGGELLRIAKHEDFTGKKGQVLTLHTFGKLAAKKLRVAVLAPKDPKLDDYRSVAVSAARAARDLRTLAVYAPGNDPEQLRSLGEGLLLGNYRYAEFLTGSRKPKPSPRGILVTAHKPTAAEKKAMEEAQAVADAVNLTRDLVNAPPNELTATKLANEARRVARE